MLEIHCPYCRETRAEEEFCYEGEAHIARPADPRALSDEQWSAYLFLRKNPRGLHHGGVVAHVVDHTDEAVVQHGEGLAEDLIEGGDMDALEAFGVLFGHRRRFLC